MMGKRMFEEGEVGWPDPPPFRAPVFVVTHEKREPWQREGGTTFHFVTDGFEAALKQAGAAAGDKDVRISGGANTVQQALDAGLVDEIQIHYAPVLLGEGVRLFEQPSNARSNLEIDRVVASPGVTHVRYRVMR